MLQLPCFGASEKVVVQPLGSVPGATPWPGIQFTLLQISRYNCSNFKWKKNCTRDTNFGANRMSGWENFGVITRPSPLHWWSRCSLLPQPARLALRRLARPRARLVFRFFCSQGTQALYAFSSPETNYFCSGWKLAWHADRTFQLVPGPGQTHVVISQTHRLVSQERLSPRAGTSDLIPITPSSEQWF